MTVHRNATETFDCSKQQLLTCILRVLENGAAEYTYTDIVFDEANSVVHATIKPNRRLLLRTKMEIVVCSNGHGCNVTVRTCSQWYVFGDALDFYRRYIRDFLRSLRAQLEESGDQRVKTQAGSDGRDRPWLKGSEMEGICSVTHDEQAVPCSGVCVLGKFDKLYLLLLTLILVQIVCSATYGLSLLWQHGTAFQGVLALPLAAGFVGLLGRKSWGWMIIVMACAANLLSWVLCFARGVFWQAHYLDFRQQHPWMWIYVVAGSSIISILVLFLSIIRREEFAR